MSTVTDGQTPACPKCNTPILDWRPYGRCSHCKEPFSERIDAQFGYIPPGRPKVRKARGTDDVLAVADASQPLGDGKCPRCQKPLSATFERRRGAGQAGKRDWMFTVGVGLLILGLVLTAGGTRTATPFSVLLVMFGVALVVARWAMYLQKGDVQTGWACDSCGARYPEGVGSGQVGS